MDWTKLLDTRLLGAEEREPSEDRPHSAQDYDRLVFSAPFRRLANKTQVHPLYADDHLHHRLIHSIETSSVGRSLGLQVGHWLESEGRIAGGARHIVSGVVQAAAIAHDIGNPPFGHSGESAIGDWFASGFKEGGAIFDGLSSEERSELENFEGNAQGFRLLTRLEMYRNAGGMQLSYATLGAFSKYPTLCATSKAKKDQAEKAGEAVYKGLKKYGLFRSEYSIFEQVAGRLGLIEGGIVEGRKWWRRHPLVLLVEAADDICYNIIDLEDAVNAGDLPAEQVKALLAEVFGGTSRQFDEANEEIAYYRARAIGSAIPACVEAFKSHYDAIMVGEFSGALVDQSAQAVAFGEIEKAANKQIFTAPRKTRLEVAGRAILHRVLDGLLPVLKALQEKKWNQDELPDHLRQIVSATQIDLRDVRDEYSALQALADYVSGMTDRYAVKVDRILSGRID
ncbi:dGTP triphosphohydrolase [Thioclava pacifica]|uniref:HD/PDEase domain-containing protein n=1 Tax=Thioclava pacifica DSM 10166 TaxID=1353537 RepID=A0A074J3N0_9RHOB|nr:dNTP triphosphohydrolase [Thioclava pacifica]KEO50540.1 hypothetical protein TP2_14835 [Thioclava pacifica DSM 10166]